MPFSRRSLLVAALGVAAGCAGERGGSAAGRPPPDPQVTRPGASTPANGSAIPPATVSSLAMVGDSITARSKASLTKVFAAQGIAEVRIDAEVSRRIEVGNGRNEPLNGEKALSNMLAFGVDPDAWVIALGTNDVGVTDADHYAVLIDTMLGMLPATTPAVWVDVYRPAVLVETKSFNAVLRARVGRRPNTAVASWFDVVAGNSKRLLTGDRIHPNEAGQTAFAALVGGAVAKVP